MRAVFLTSSLTVTYAPRYRHMFVPVSVFPISRRENCRVTIALREAERLGELPSFLFPVVYTYFPSLSLHYSFRLSYDPYRYGVDIFRVRTNYTRPSRRMGERKFMRRQNTVNQVKGSCGGCRSLRWINKSRSENARQKLIQPKFHDGSDGAINGADTVMPHINVKAKRALEVIFAQFFH